MITNYFILLFICLIIFETALITVFKVFVHKKMGYLKDSYLYFEYGSFYSLLITLGLVLIMFLELTSLYSILIILVFTVIEFGVFYKRKYDMESIKKYLVFILSTAVVSFVLLDVVTRLLIQLF